MNKNNLNQLRIERQIIQSRLKNLQPKLSLGIRNTRKHQNDAEKVTKLTLRLSELESEITSETQKLIKLRTANINIADSPILQSMTQRTPTKSKVTDIVKDDQLNQTFIEARPISQKNPPLISESIPPISQPISKQLQIQEENLDFQEFVKNTVGLSGAIGGSIPKKLDFQVNPIVTEIFTGANIPASYFSNTQNTGVSHLYDKPIVTEFPKDIKNKYKKTSALIDDKFQQKPLVSRHPFTISHSSPFATDNQTITPSEINLPQNQRSNIDSNAQTFQNIDQKSEHTKSASEPQIHFQAHSVPYRPRFSQTNYRKEFQNDSNQNFESTPNFELPKSKETIVSSNQPQPNPSNISGNQPEMEPRHSMNNRTQSNNNGPEPRAYNTQPQSNRDNVRNEQINITPQTNFPVQNFQIHPNAAYQNPRQGLNMPPEQISGNFYQNENVHINSARPRDTFLRRLRCIPKFNGDTFPQLKEFIDVVESLYVSCANENEENELYEQILLQVRGEARNIVMALNNPEWETIKNKLLSHFSYLANKEILTSQIENARQEEKETLNEYADRVRKLLKEKNATYAYMTEDQKLEYNRLARRSFSRGINNLRLRNRLVTRGASSLEDAIAYAIEAENDEINYIPNTDLYCRKCNRNGHRLRECTNTNDNNNNTEIGRLISAIRAIGGQNRGQSFQNGNNNIRSNGFTNNFNPNRNNFQNWNPNNNTAFNRNPNVNRWNTNTSNYNRNFNPNYSMPNRTWDSNNSNYNRNFNPNFSTPNRNWDSNNFTPNRNWNENWNRDQIRGQNQEQIQNQVQNQNSNRNFDNNNRNVIDNAQQTATQPNPQRNQYNAPYRQNRNNYNQQRPNERPGQNNNIITVDQNASARSSSTENSASENQ